MKRKVTALLTALLLTLTLCVPALAWTEYGAIYDETDALGSDELSDLGQYTLPQLTEALHLDLRVDRVPPPEISPHMFTKIPATAGARKRTASR